MSDLSNRRLAETVRSVAGGLVSRVTGLLPIAALLVLLACATLIVLRPGLLLQSSDPYSIKLSGAIASWVPVDVSTRFTAPVPVLLLVGTITTTSAILFMMLERGEAGSAQSTVPIDRRLTGSDRTVSGQALTELVAESKSPETSLAVKRRHRDEIRELLQEAAVTAFVHHERCSRAEALDRLSAGEWPDDPRASAFLGGPAAADVPLRTRILDWLHPEPTFHRRADRTAEVLHRYVHPEEHTDD